MVKKVKFETKRLGYLITVNSLLWVNIVIGYYFKSGNIEAVTSIVKYLGILGVCLLLGRKFVGELIVKIVNLVAAKK